MIDLHCHVLPGIDDGPETIEAAVALVRASLSAGADTIVATPHVSWRYRNDHALIAAKVAELNDALAAEGLDAHVLAGSEVAATHATELEQDELAHLTLGGSKSILLEPPFSPVVTGFDEVAFSLIARGHRVLIAHPERCPAFHRDLTMLEELVGAGALASITARSLTSQFGAPVRRLAFRLLDEGLAHNVASDAHDAIARPPGIAAELASIDVDEPLTLWLTQLVPAAILADEPIPPRPPSRARRQGRGLVGRLLRK